MKVFPSVYAQLRNSTSVTGENVTCLIEWNINRYFKPKATNSLAEPFSTGEWAGEGNDKNFPLDSLSDLNKFGSGIAYILNDPASLKNVKFYDYGKMKEATRQSIPARYYYIDADSRYRYYISENQSAWAGSAGHYSLPYCAPTLEYEAPFSANKLSLKFNVHISKPSAILIETSIDNITWNTLATSTQIGTVPSNGIVDLWAPTGGGPWTTTPNYHGADGSNYNLKGMRFIKVTVSEMDKPGARLEFLEIAPKIEVSAINSIDTFSVTNSLSEDSEFAPVGLISANTGSISISNSNGFFDKRGGTSPVANYLDENATVRIYNDYGGPSVPIATMLSDKWNVDDDTCSIELVDYARILQDASGDDMLLEGWHGASLVWAICDAIGFRDVVILETVPGQTPRVDQFWSSKDEKVWDVLSKLAKDLQMSISMDETGVLRVMSKEYIYATRTTDWTARQNAFGSEKPDIIDIKKSSMQGSNKVVVNYSATSDYTISRGKNRTFWNAPADLRLGAAELTRDLLIDDTYAYINASKPELMPNLKGRFTVNGETLKYKGLEFKTDSGVKSIVSDLSDYWRVVEENNGRPARFTGRISLKDLPEENHYSHQARLANYYKVSRFSEGSGIANTKRYSHGCWSDGRGGVVLKNPHSNFSGRDTFCRVTAVKDTGGSFNRVGMKFKIEGHRGGFGQAGLMLFPSGQYDQKGYIFQVTCHDDPRITHNPNIVGETKGWRVETDGTHTLMDHVSPSRTKETEDLDYFKNKHTVVTKNRWHYMEVVRRTSKSGTHLFAVYIDNKCVKVYKDPAGPSIAPNHWAGFYATAGTTLRVEKFYSIDLPSGRAYSHLPSEVKTFYPDDSDIVEMDHARIAKANKAYKKKHPKAKRIPAPYSRDNRLDYRFHMYINKVDKYKSIKVDIDDFSGTTFPILREVLVANYRYTDDTVPAKTATLYVSNARAYVSSFKPGPMGARITISHSSKTPVFLQKDPGEFDNIPQSAREERMFIYGNAVHIGEVQKVEKKSEALIRQGGEQILDFDSKWIQGASRAQSLADWVWDNFSASKETLQIELFGNPLLQVGDSLTVSHSSVTAGTFVIKSLTNSWENGLKTSLTAARSY